MNERTNVLFICAMNQWRSPTAERAYRNDPRVSVRSAGVNQSARRRISGAELDWADLVLTMEQAHIHRIREQFRAGEIPAIECLDIPDDFRFGDPELIKLIRQATEPLLESFEEE